MFDFVRQRIDSWLFLLGAPEPGEVFLRQRRVFIVPSGAGIGFAAMLIVLFIGSVNYSLSVGFGLTFLLSACALIDMHLTFRNLAHMYLSAGRTQPVFAGAEARFDLQLINRSKHDRYAIWIGFHERKQAYPMHATDIAAQSSSTVSLGLTAEKRGWLTAPRVRLQTRFPLGLFRAWSYWHPDMRVLVYPQPELTAPPLPFATATRSDGKGTAGEEDFAGVRAYQHGDTMKRLSWRHIARMDTQSESALITKHFEGGAAAEMTFDFAQLPGNLSIEQKLSRLTRWVLDAESQGLPYAFRLGDNVFSATCGEAQRTACLRALALYGL